MIEQIPIDDPRWTAFVARMPAALPFHHPGWARAIARCYGFELFGIALRGGESANGDEAYVAGIPTIELRNPVTRRRRWSSLPFTDVCPPLVEPGWGGRFARSLDAYRLAEGISSLEVRGHVPETPQPPMTRHVIHRLALDADPDHVARGYRASVRRNIRAARAAGLKPRRAWSETDMVDIFYSLQLMTRRRLGLPPQPRRFFRAIWNEVLSTGLGHLTIVEAAGTPVAAAVFLEWNGIVVYKYGASDPRAWNLRPNNLIFAEEIAAACVRGNVVFDFGRTDVGDEGLRRFKLGWGAEEEPVQSTWFGAAPRNEPSGPPELLRTLIRRSPPILARAVGEGFYRYVA